MRGVRWLVVSLLLTLVVGLLPGPALEVSTASAGAGVVATTPEGAPAFPPANAAGATAQPVAKLAATDAARSAEPTSPPRPRRKKWGRSSSYNPYAGDPAAEARARTAGWRGPANPPLDVLVTSGVLSDPLGGNAVLIPVEEFAVLNDIRGGLLTLDTLTPTLQLGGTSSGVLVGPWGNAAGGSQNALAGLAADITGDGIDELLIVLNQGSATTPCLAPTVFTLDRALNIASAAPQTPCETTLSQPPLQSQTARLVAGNFYAGAANGSGQQVAMVWNAQTGSSGPQNICVRIWDNAVGSSTLTRRGIDCSAGPVITSSPSQIPERPDSGFPIPAQFAVTTGDLNGDGVDELIVASIAPYTLITQNSFSNQTTATLTIFGVSAQGQPAPLASTTVTCACLTLALAIGDFDAAGRDAIALLTQEGSFLIADRVPIAFSVNTRLRTFAATGNLSGLTQGNSGQAADLNGGKPSFSFASFPAYPVFTGSIAGAAAPFLTGGTSSTPQLAVAWQTGNPCCREEGSGKPPVLDTRLSLFAIGGANSALTVSTLLDGYATGVSLTSGGPLPNPPGFATSTSANQLSIAVGGSTLAAPTPLLVVAQAGAVQSLDNPQPGPGVVQAFRLTANGNTVSVSPAGSFTVANPESGNGQGGLGVIAGDFAGLSLRARLIGTHQYQQLGQLEALIQAPPTHQDVFPDIGAAQAVTVNVNTPSTDCLNNYQPNFCTAIGFVTATGTSTSQTVAFQRTWGISVTASVDASEQAEISSQINASLTAAYGSNFSNTTQSIASSTTTSGVIAQNDDALIYSATDFTIWEYAVYRQGQPVSDLAVVWPVTICQGTVLPNGVCQGTLVASSNQVTAPGSQVPWYYPATEPLNTLSYPAITPTDLLTSVISLSSQPQVTLGNTYSYQVNQANQNVNSQSSQWDLNVQAAVTASIGYSIPDVFQSSASLGLEGNYGVSVLSGQALAINSSTTLGIYFNGLSNTTPVASGAPQYGTQSQWSYTVTPYYYIATGTYGRVFNTVNSLNGPMWSQVYTQPDFAFIAPYKYAVGTPTQWETTDIRFSQVPTPTAGTPVTIAALVRNYSPQPFQGGQPLEVAFYNGNPAQGGQLLGTRPITAIGARGSQAAVLTFTPGQAGCYPIWVLLDPNKRQPEVHKANNQGWANLSVFQPGGSGDDPCGGVPSLAPGASPRQHLPRQRKGSQLALRVPGGGGPDLSIGQADFSATTVRLNGQPVVQLRAAVRAIGAHYSNVAVTFYDGNPARGGRYIGHEVIPLIWAGYKSTAAVDWVTTGLTGTRDVYAIVTYDPRLEARPENNSAWASVTLQPGAPTPTVTPTPVIPELSPLVLFGSGLLALAGLGLARRRPSGRPHRDR